MQQNFWYSATENPSEVCRYSPKNIFKISKKSGEVNWPPRSPHISPPIHNWNANSSKVIPEIWNSSNQIFDKKFWLFLSTFSAVIKEFSLPHSSYCQEKSDEDPLPSAIQNTTFRVHQPWSRSKSERTHMFSWQLRTSTNNYLYLPHVRF